MDILTSNYMLHHNLAGSSLMDDFKYAYGVILSVATLAASRWTNCCLRCCSGPASDALDEAPIDWLDLDPLSLG